jgi:ABC-type branched-subunit amino acid transport system ATPase component
MRLSADGIVKRFGEVTVLDGVSIEATPGAITGLIGPNGSGKSTLFDVITGVVPGDGGNVSLDGEPFEGGLAKLARSGVVRTFQVPRVALHMTVLENLMAAPREGAGERLTRLISPLAVKRVRADERDRRDRSLALAAELSLERMAEEYAEVLSGGQLKLLSIGIALMMDPRVLLLDEPTAGVNPVVTARILDLLRARSRDGCATLVIEHNIPALAEVCELVHVLDAGRIIASGTPEDVRRDERVVDAYIGRRRPQREREAT